jgi:hypothetical protein
MLMPAPPKSQPATTLYVVPCGKAKVWDKEPHRGPVPAGEAYTGTLAGTAARYARQSGQPWIVLSAKYGFLDPEELVPGAYDTTFAQKSPDLVPVETLRRQLTSKQLARYDEVVVLGSKAYASHVRAAFAGTRVRIRTPLAGVGGLVLMAAKVRRALATGESL